MTVFYIRYRPVNEGGTSTLALGCSHTCARTKSLLSLAPTDYIYSAVYHNLPQ